MIAFLFRNRWKVVFVCIGLSIFSVYQLLTAELGQAAVGLHTVILTVSITLLLRVGTLLSRSREQVEECRDRFLRALAEKNPRMLEEAREAVAIHEKNFTSHNTAGFGVVRRLRTLTAALREVFENLRQSNWTEACREISQTDVDLTKIEEDFPSAKPLTRAFRVNRSACRGYLRAEGNGVVVEQLRSHAQTFHEALNAIEKSPLTCVESFFKLLSGRDPSFNPDHIEPKELLKRGVRDTVILGAMGSLTMVFNQYSLESPDRRERLFNLLDEYGYELEIDGEVTLSRICRHIFVNSTGARSYSGAVNDVVDVWKTVLPTASLLKSFLLVNRNLLLRYPPSDTLDLAERLAAAGERFEEATEIAVLNAEQQIIEDGIPKSQRRHLDKAQELLETVDSSRFYFDGYRLIRSISAWVTRDQDPTAALRQLANNSSNFMVSARASRNLMTLYARAEKKRQFEEARERYVEICESKNLNPLVVEMDNARQLPLGGGKWFYVRVPMETEFFPFYVRPWGDAVV